MSSLMVSQDSHLMMLEIAVESIFIPWSTKFDVAVMKKTKVMFRMLDDEWTVLMPNRRDNKSYRGSNFEKEPFYGGKSVVFAIPYATLEEDVCDVDVQFSVHKEVSDYFETNFPKDARFTLVAIDNLFNGIIKELRERKELADYLAVPGEREPISRSLKGVYPLLDSETRITESTIELYARLSYLGKSVVTDMRAPLCAFDKFFVAEETNQCHPYQCRELRREDLESGRWGSMTFLPPIPSDCLICQCLEEISEKSDRAVGRTRKNLCRRRRSCGKRPPPLCFDYDQILRRLVKVAREIRRGTGAVDALIEKSNKCESPPVELCLPFTSRPVLCQYIDLLC